jgi:hypothetical protein
VKQRFPVLNPRASLAEVARYIRCEPQAVPCVGGYKHFYLDWNLDIWRCEAWNEPLGSIFDLDRIPDQREPCNACMMACYRSASMLMHAAVAATDAAPALAAGHIGSAVASLFRRSVAQSLWALVEETPKMRRLGGGRRRTAAETRLQSRGGGTASESPLLPSEVAASSGRTPGSPSQIDVRNNHSAALRELNARNAVFWKRQLRG